MTIKTNADISIRQQGSAGASQANLDIGGLSGYPYSFNPHNLRFALSANSPDFVTFTDHFIGDLLRDEWATTIATGGTLAVATSLGGMVSLVTDATDDDAITLALGLHWKADNAPIFFEAAVKSDTAITLRAIEVGLSDALSESNGLAFSNHTAAGVTDVADDAVIFGYDTDAAMTTWAVNTVKAGTPQAVEIAAAPSTSAFQRLGIVLLANGTAHFYVDRVLVATVEDAITTTVALTPWISMKSLSAAAKSVSVDYVVISAPLGY